MIDHPPSTAAPEGSIFRRSHGGSARSLRAVALLAASAAAGACGDPGGHAATASATARDSAGVRIVENPAPAAAEGIWRARPAPDPELEIGAGDGPGQQLFRVTAGLVLGDGGVAVVDGGSAELRLYGPDGALRDARGGEGKGPGEFIRATGLFRAAGDSLLVWDSGLRRATLVDPDGGAPRVTLFEGDLFSTNLLGVLDDGGWVVLDGALPGEADGSVQRMTLHRLRYRSDGAFVDSLGTHRGVPGRFSRTSSDAIVARMDLYVAMPREVVSGDGIWVAPADRPELRASGPDGALRTVARWEASRVAVTDDHVQASLDAALETTPEDIHPLVRSSYLDRARADTFPVVSDMVPAGGGGVWVRPYATPGDTSERDGWLAFDRDGRLEGVVELPRGWRVLEAGSDRVLAVAPDEMDVERVRLVRLERIEAGDGAGAGGV